MVSPAQVIDVLRQVGLEMAISLRSVIVSLNTVNLESSVFDLPKNDNELSLSYKKIIAGAFGSTPKTEDFA